MRLVAETGDDAVVVDMVAVLLKSNGGRQWSLDICALLLPLIDNLFTSRYDS